MEKKKDKVLFWIENFQIHFGISKSLIEKYDCEAFGLIVSSKKQKKFFDNQKLVNFKKSWYLRDNVNLENHTPNIEKLKMFEKKYSLSLRKIIYGERFFYKYNKYHKFTDEKIFSIIEQELEFYIKILDEVKPDYVFLRLPEYQDIRLFYEICQAKKIPVLILSFTRFSDRWMLSSEADVPILLENIDESLEIKSFDELIDSSTYYETNTLWMPKQKSSLSQKFNVLKLLFSTFNSSNLNNYRDIGKTPWTTIKNRIELIVKSFFRQRFLDKNAKISYSQESSFAFFPLHGEPEEKILIRSQFFSDQLAVIKNISQSLPIEMDLFVKEHPGMKLLGWRNLDYYKKILEMPNVQLIHPSVSTEELIKKSSMVIAIAGTSAFEAAFYKKPSIVFTNVIFSVLSSVFTVKIMEDLPNVIKKCLNSKVDLIELNQYMDKIKKSSFSIDLFNLTTSASHIFGIGGFLDNNSISEPIMKEFLEKYKKEFDKLAEEHIKKINLIKNNN
tara:strand:+ start:8186 stop:9688 length:1503 start_codon:yes stop_codon:yes gene_type:complete